MGLRLAEAFTPFYRNFVEKQLTAADKYLKAQLIECNATDGTTDEMIFRVWSPSAHGDDNESGSDESSGSDDDESEELIVPQFCASYPMDELHPDFDDPLEAPSGQEIIAPTVCTDGFRWLRVRTVVVTYSTALKEWIMKCSCGLLERTCCPCRHTFCVSKLIIQNYCIKNLRYNRRCYKGFYHMVMCSNDAFCVQDGDIDVYPLLPKSLVDPWIASSPTASSVGVPVERLFTNVEPDNEQSTFEADSFQMDYDDATETRRPDRPTRRHSTAATLQHQLLAIIELLGPQSANVTGYNRTSDLLKSHTDDLSREARISVPGRGRQNRTIRISDLGSGGNPKHGTKHSALPGASQSKFKLNVDLHNDAHPALRKPQKEEDASIALREIIRKDGVEEGFFVEVYTPDSVPATDRWFMKIVDGSVIGTDPKK